MAQALRTVQDDPATGRRYQKNPLAGSRARRSARVGVGRNRSAPRDHVVGAFQDRRNQIVGDCIQLQVDVEFYNGRNPDQEPIQMVLNFTNDVERPRRGRGRRRRSVDPRHSGPTVQTTSRAISTARRASLLQGDRAHPRRHAHRGRVRARCSSSCSLLVVSTRTSVARRSASATGGRIRGFFALPCPGCFHGPRIDIKVCRQSIDLTVALNIGILSLWLTPSTLVSTRPLTLVTSKRQRIKTRRWRAIARAVADGQ